MPTVTNNHPSAGSSRPHIVFDAAAHVLERGENGAPSFTPVPIERPREDTPLLGSAYTYRPAARRPRLIQPRPPQPSDLQTAAKGAAWGGTGTAVFLGFITAGNEWTPLAPVSVMLGMVGAGAAMGGLVAFLNKDHEELVRAGRRYYTLA